MTLILQENLTAFDPKADPWLLKSERRCNCSTLVTLKKPNWRTISMMNTFTSVIFHFIIKNCTSKLFDELDPNLELLSW